MISVQRIRIYRQLSAASIVRTSSETLAEILTSRNLDFAQLDFCRHRHHRSQQYPSGISQANRADLELALLPFSLGIHNIGRVGLFLIDSVEDIDTADDISDIVPLELIRIM